MSIRRWLLLAVVANVLVYGAIALLASQTPAQAYVPERPTVAHVKTFECSIFDPGDCETNADAWLAKLVGRITDRKVVAERGRLVIVIFYEVLSQSTPPPAPKPKPKKLPAEAPPK